MIMTGHKASSYNIVCTPLHTTYPHLYFLSFCWKSVIYFLKISKFDKGLTKRVLDVLKFDTGKKHNVTINI